jgi:hypothetical protein
LRMTDTLIIRPATANDLQTVGDRPRLLNIYRAVILL